ncbi:MAG: ribonuclease P protein component [Alphaproteobacteria bacterium]|nr:ribonuclease P protein component [Alphaproteobacteria bacterium]
MQRLKRRQDFVAAAKGVYQPMPAFVVQGLNRKDAGPARVGFTCTKKLGNAVTRNRIRRRLKEATRLCLGPHAKPGFDYVVIGRADAEHRPFEVLMSDLISATTRLHSKAETASQVRP